MVDMYLLSPIRGSECLADGVDLYTVSMCTYFLFKDALTDILH